MLTALQNAAAREPIIDSYYPGDKLMWDHIMASTPAVALDQVPGGAIIPHHAITDFVTARFYQGLSNKINPKTIYILCPNHFETGTHPIQTGKDMIYRTVYGTLSINQAMVDRLLASQLIFRSEASFPQEHGIYFHAPYIKRWFPDATIVPILLNWDTPRNHLDQFVDLLAGIIDPQDFVIASVDFSHYNRRQVADFHDYSAYASIVNFDFDALFDLEIDSPPSIYVLEKLMQNRGFHYPIRIFHTNSDDFNPAPEKITTSHQYFVFYHGDKALVKTLTILFSGTISTAHPQLEIKTSWPWDRQYNPVNDPGPAKFLDRIRGQEDRFFMGYDLYILGKTHQDSFHIAKNGLSVTVLGKTMEKHPLSAEIESIRKMRQSGERLVLVYQVTPNIPKTELVYTTRALIEAGVDILICQGITTKPEVEKYKHGIIAYSLGEFIGKQGRASGLLLQVLITENDTEYREIPIQLRAGHPQVSSP